MGRPFGHVESSSRCERFRSEAERNDDRNRSGADYPRVVDLVNKRVEPRRGGLNPVQRFSLATVSPASPNSPSRLSDRSIYRDLRQEGARLGTKCFVNTPNSIRERSSFGGLLLYARAEDF